MRIGAYSLVILWIARTFVTTVSHVFFITFFAFFRSVLTVPMDTLAYEKARSRGLVEHLVFREIFINFGKVIALIVMLITASYIATFMFTAVAQFLLFLF